MPVNGSKTGISLGAGSGIALRLRDNARNWHWQDESTTASEIVRLLPNDLVTQVPRKQNGVVRHLLRQCLRSMDRERPDWEVSPLFVRTSINHEIQLALIDSAISEEGDALGCRAVGDNSI